MLHGGYFGKPPSELDFDEVHAARPVYRTHTTNYNPVASPELARERQAQVIEKMKKAGYLEEDEKTD